MKENFLYIQATESEILINSGAAQSLQRISKGKLHVCSFIYMAVGCLRLINPYICYI